MAMTMARGRVMQPRIWFQDVQERSSCPELCCGAQSRKPCPFIGRRNEKRAFISARHWKLVPSASSHLVSRVSKSGVKAVECSNGKDHLDASSPSDVVILTNGPGEVATWVRPVVAALRRGFKQPQGSALRVSVVLAPCPHASGGELNLVRSFEEVDRSQGPEHFWQLLLLNRTADSWDWYSKGVCVFLGGDQFSALVIGKRLGYRTIVYAEDALRWPGLVDLYVVRSLQVLQGVPTWLRSGCKVVGDLFEDAVALTEQQQDGRLENGASDAIQLKNRDQTTGWQTSRGEEAVRLLGLLPGSKNIKLAIGVPYLMAVAEILHKRMDGRVQFLLPLAPTVSVEMLTRQGDPKHNKYITKFNWCAGNVRTAGKQIYLVTEGGVEIEVQQQYPSYHVYKRCCLCVTTVGTNTAELGFLGIPMVVVLPTHAIELFKGATGGLLGLLASIPGWCGDQVTRMVNMAVLRSAGYISWPNRWAGEEVVPELVGLVEPAQVADTVQTCLSGDNLSTMRSRLASLHQHREGSGLGASDRICREIERMLST